MVARYNPCGAPVEIGRRPYRTHARLYPDSEELFELKWYPARDDVKFLRGPNAINSNEWQADRPDEYDMLKVGEDPNYPRVYQNNRVNPLAIGGHQCGTAADFAGDGAINLTDPPVEYRPDGLPICCGAIFGGTGGLVLDGTAYVVRVYRGTGGLVLDGTADVPRIYRGSGGLSMGGTADVIAGTFRVGTGGLVLDGTADVVEGTFRVGTGGLVLDGTADVVEGTFRIGSGGLVLDGTADVVEGGFWFRDQPGEYTFTAEFTGQHAVYCWGGGGGGAVATGGGGMDFSGGGGGGGAFAKLYPVLVEGVDYIVRVGAGSSGGGGDGEDTEFEIASIVVVLAKGGSDALGPTFGAGGDGSASTGLYTYSGGNGADGQIDTQGGGGGSSAVNVNDGGPPGTWADALGPVGGVAPNATGGDGGDGGAVGDGGVPGFGPGGGGGGSGATASDPPGAGAAGKIVIFWPA